MTAPDEAWWRAETIKLQQIWRAGGLTERLFSIAPYLWGAYVVAVIVWIAERTQSFENFLTLAFVALTLPLLERIWWFPVLSTRVIRELAEGGVFRSEANVRALGEYLAKHEGGGPWRRGVHFAGTYLVFFVLWGLVAAHWMEISGLGRYGGFLATAAFATIHIAVSIGLFLSWRKALEKFLRAVSRRGFQLSW